MPLNWNERQVLMEILIPSTIEIDRFKKVLLDGTDEEAAEAFQNLVPACEGPSLNNACQYE